MWINVKQDLDQGKTEIDQTDYLKRLLDNYGMLNCKTMSHPVKKNFDFGQLKRERSESVEIESECRQLIGSLMYVVVGSRPDLCSAVTMLSRYQCCASKLQYKTLLKVLRYVKGTIDLKLTYYQSDDQTVEGFVDSDLGGNKLDMKSTTGFCFKIFGSKKQTTVALSSAEAEYVALSVASSEAWWLKKVLSDFHIKTNEVILYEDNQPAIKIAQNPEVRKIKHLDLKKYFVKEK